MEGFMRNGFRITAAVAIVAAFAGAAGAVNVNWSGLEAAQTQTPAADEEPELAIGGYDPTLYFAGGQPKPGMPSINYVFEGQLYYFATYESRAAFMADPMAYAPQYAGHCAFAMSQHHTVRADPSVFAVQDGKLFLFENEMKLEMWRTNSRRFRVLADKRWEIEAKNFTNYKARF